MGTVSYQNMYLQNLAQTVQLPGGQKSDTNGSASNDFQNLLERAQNPKDVDPPQSAQKPQTSTKRKDTSAQKEEEDPVETVKRMQVYLVPEDPEVLSQYPASWLPEVSEGEAIVCIGVQTDENGQQMPILIGANEAANRGMQVLTPEVKLQTLNIQEEVQPEVLIQEPAVVDEEAPQVGVQPQEQTPVQEMVKSSSTEGRSADAFSAETGAQKDSDGEITVENANAQPQALFRDVEAAPIKVGETYTAQQSGEPESVENQLAGPLTEALAQGESKVQIQLEPESLGSVTVEITQSADGGLHVALSAANAQTRGLLEKHTENLQALLGARGQENVRVEVQRQEESQQGQNDHPYDGHNGNAQQEQQEQQQQNHHRQHSQQQTQDFLQQLRLGLIPMDAEVS